MTSVRHTLFLAERDERSGLTRREHWEEAGVEIYEPEVWAAGSHLLEWFWDIDGSRTMLPTMGGPAIVNPVGATGIETWGRITGTVIEPDEARALLAMDRARVAGPEEFEQSEEAASQCMNVAMFDAMFGEGKG